MVELVVVGYPRSGNCWIARMLGEALNVRVVGIHGGRDSIAAEGFGRNGRGHVKQAHYWSGKEGNLAINPDEKDSIFLHIIRNPMDIAVSAAHYWEWSLDTALDKMIDGPGPLELPPWSEYVESWFRHYVPILRYEDFHEDALRELGKVLDYLELKPQKSLHEVVINQSFAIKKKMLEREGNGYPFGRVEQLRHMRRGAVGDWQQEFSKKQEQRARKAWNGLLRRVGYDA